MRERDRERETEEESKEACACVRAQVYVCPHMCICVNVGMYRGEMRQLPCPRAHETHVMRIQLIFLEARHVTSHTWAIKKKMLK